MDRILKLIYLYTCWSYITLNDLQLQEKLYLECNLILLRKKYAYAQLPVRYVNAPKYRKHLFITSLSQAPPALICTTLTNP